MGWSVEFHEKALEELDSLSTSFQEKFDYIFNRIELNGLFSLGAKHSKYIEDGIWELRAASNDGIARSLYVTEKNQVVKILVAFAKKTEKTPRDKIELAKNRRCE